MNPQQRRSQMVAAIRGDGEVSVETLARRFDVSVETVRRDLARLARDGLVDKVHGGARPPRLTVEGSLAERMDENAAAKRIIGGKLASLISGGETIFLDTGSTTIACAEALALVEGLTVITNSFPVARILGETATVYVVGGRYASGNSQTIGPLALSQIGGFRADRAVITVSALDAEGAMDSSLDEAVVAGAMIDAARQLVVVADSTKFGKTAGFRVCPLPEIDILVSDAMPELPLAGALSAAEVQLV